MDKIKMKEGDNNSNDVEAVESKMEEEVSEEKPIMSLFKRLISSDNKQNTVLTNAQIKDILLKEFDIETSNLHELEEDIYLNVMKKFLKDWPQWDEFDRTIINLKVKGDYAGLNTILQIKYKSLRKYLKLMLSIAEPLARDNMKTVENMVPKNKKTNNLNDVVLVVHCNRVRLNKLFFRHPQWKLNGTVFNIEDPGPSRISVAKPTIAGILNSFGIRVEMTIEAIAISRFTCHKLDHVLINKKLNIPRQNNNAAPNELTQVKNLHKHNDVEKQAILDNLTNAYKRFKKNNDSKALAILEVIIMDIAESPKTLKVPACYRKYMSQYQFKRYLNADAGESNDEKYDLRLEETISPRYQYTVHKFGATNGKVNSFQVECTICGTKYKDDNMLSDLEQHYLGFHSQQPDVICTNCKRTFSVEYLMEKRWCHKC